MRWPTRILDEDAYPVGGFTSISTRGSMESLLQSQLAFMEPGAADRPDLFDIKYVRDELLYYSRDENQLLRRRRTFVLALAPDLIATRFKDADLPYQRGILLLALLVVVIRKLTEWLTTDALSFQVLFLKSDQHRNSTGPLENEMALLQTLLRKEILNGVVHIATVPEHELADQCGRRRRQSLCHCLTVAANAVACEAEETVVTQLEIAGPRPAVADPTMDLTVLESEDAIDSWGLATEHILRRWV